MNLIGQLDCGCENAVYLAHREFGKSGKTPLLILHGLVGSSRNWTSAAKILAEDFDVYALDLRNHGDSGFSDSHTYEEVVQDVSCWLEGKNLGPVVLMGHSMGGKVAMQFACRFPEKLRALVVVDVAPKAYDSRWKKEFQAMLSLNLAALRERREAEDHLEKAGVDDWAFRKFLVSNLQREKDLNFRWQINVPVLYSHLEEIFKSGVEPDQSFEGPSLFFRGSESNFVLDSDQGLIDRSFPENTIITVPGAGHNVHVDKRDHFVRDLLGWWNDLSVIC